MGTGIPVWTVVAAKEIDLVLSEAVQKNTDCRSGYFSGVSIKDIAGIIWKHAEERGAEMSESDRLIVALKALTVLGNQHPDRDPDNPRDLVCLMAAFARSTVEQLTKT